MKTIKQTAYVNSIIILVIILTSNKSVSQISANQQFINDAKRTENKDTAHLQSRNLKLAIATNASYGKVHKAGYSGVSELYIKTGNEKDLFAPLYAGLNFEHIFSGDSPTYKWNAYETRTDTMKLVRLSTTKVELQQ